MNSISYNLPNKQTIANKNNNIASSWYPKTVC
jgi:hypothetical protein